jgi:hypothetical protein
MKYYFYKHDNEECYTLDYFKDQMLKHEGHTASIEIRQAKKDKDSYYFWCNQYLLAGEKGECGKICEDYSPRNKKNGICRHHRSAYEPTDQIFILEKKGDKFKLKRK